MLPWAVYMLLFDRYKNFIREAAILEPHARHDLLLACIRSLLQTTALCLFDVAAHACDDGTRKRDLANIASERWLDKDRQPIDVIGRLLALIKRALPEPWPTWCGELERMLRDCKKWVEHRNDVAHGVPNLKLIQDQIPFLEKLANNLVEAACDVLPANNAPPFYTRSSIRLSSFPDRPIDAPLVFRGFGRKATGHRMDCVALDVHADRRFAVDLTRDAPIVRLRPFDLAYEPYLPTTGWMPNVRLLEKPNTFMHRAADLNEMDEWWADDTTKNILFIWGNAGYGKTTLVLQFLHQKLAPETTPTYRPKLVCFTTAKRTQYGIDGYKQFTPDTSSIGNVGRLVLEGVGDTSVVSRKGNALWDFIAGRVANEGIDTRDTLIVIDNAETLTTDDSAAKRFADEVDYIASKLGFRVIVTSRRREQFKNVSQLSVTSFNEQESIEFAKELAKSPPLASVLQSTDELRKAMIRFEGIPLLITTFVERMRQDPRDIKTISNELATKDSLGLARFRYEDAWDRTHVARRNVLIALHCVGPCSSDLIGQFCVGFGTTLVALENEALIQAKFVESHSYANGMKDYWLHAWSQPFVEFQYNGLENAQKEAIKDTIDRAFKDADPALGALPAKTFAYREGERARRAHDYAIARTYFKQALVQEPENHELGIAVAKFFVECAYYEDLLDPEMDRLLGETTEGALLMARAAASLPRISGEAFDLYLDKARRAQVDPLDLSALIAQHSITRLESRKPPRTDELAVPMQPHESEAAWEQRREKVREEIQQQYETEGEDLRRSAAVELEKAFARLEKLAENRQQMPRDKERRDLIDELEARLTSYHPPPSPTEF